MPEDTLDSLETAIGQHPKGIPLRALAAELDSQLSRRTLQDRLAKLTAAGRIVREGQGRGTVYRPNRAVQADAAPAAGAAEVQAPKDISLSEQVVLIREQLRQTHLSVPVDQRTPVGYRREFLDDDYRPTGGYLSADERNALWETGRIHDVAVPGGTYGRHILDRMLIDLSWNSSRLEGNTYSLLDTKRLIERGEEAENHDPRETQMILNHKQAIEFLTDAPDEVGLDKRTILNLHALLADNLLPDPSGVGRLRARPVGIGGSAYRPLGVPALIEECFERLLAIVRAIDDPFEQALYCLVQVPYLQAFDDVNKRVSRLAANIPLIRHNLSPLSFLDVPRDYYTDAMLLIYEQNEVGLMKELFIWAYGRSAVRYGTVRQSLGEPDPFKLKHRDALRELVSQVIRDRLGVAAAAERVAAWVATHVDEHERHRFQEVAETELIDLHEGSYGRYGVSYAEFMAWRAVWAERADGAI